jgi:hypothetical protein
LVGDRLQKASPPAGLSSLGLVQIEGDQQRVVKESDLVRGQAARVIREA